ncbi:MAG TPA: twin-arginine translocation signal domain-containing protein, partial [Pirellulales bacterium]
MKSRKYSRRQFIQNSTAAVGLAATGALVVSGHSNNAAADDSSRSRNVAIIVDPADAIASSPPAKWAIAELIDILKSKNLSVRQYAKIADAKPNEFCIVAAGVKSPSLEKLIGASGMKIPDAPETVALASAGVDDRQTLFACGTDPRGLVYALLEVADRVTHADPPLAALETQKPIIEQPANAIRSISRLFVSDIEDLPWYRDKTFWRDYLNMLATERFNRFNLALGLGYDFTRDIRDSYFYFPYPFFLAVPGYNVRAVNLPDKERDENLAMLKHISDEATQRGLDFQLGLWCHAYKWTNSDKANYTIDGLNPDNHGPYCRDALAALLKACPSIAGVTIRTHGESGVTEGSYDFWKFIFDGAAKSGRKVEIDLHAKGIDEQMIDNAISTGLPVNVSPKYWAEHTGLPYQPASIRDLEKPKPGEKQATGLFSLSNGARRFMRYSYGDLMRDDRKYGVFFRMWPGSMKLLLWGDPEMASAWGRYASFCGSKGMEIQEPLSFKGKQGTGLAGGRNAYQDAALKPAADWEKYAYSYRLWGRLLYNPDTNPEV